MKIDYHSVGLDESQQIHCCRLRVHPFFAGMDRRKIHGKNTDSGRITLQIDVFFYINNFLV